MHMCCKFLRNTLLQLRCNIKSALTILWHGVLQIQMFPWIKCFIPFDKSTAFSVVFAKWGERKGVLCKSLGSDTAGQK